MVDCIVVGTGAAGMMCAGIAAAEGKTVLLLERNRICGKKLRITGKGRCNLTNACDQNTFLASVVRNPRFLFSSYAAFPPEAVMAFFESLGVSLKVERGNRVFPQSDRAADIADALGTFVLKTGVRLRQAFVRDLLIWDGAVYGVVLENGQVEEGRRVAVACGGISYPSTGSDGSGYRLAAQAGHTIIPPRGSLVPWKTTESAFCSSLQGLSLKNVALTVLRNSKVIYTDFGEMLFTHFGVSGPMVLSASCFLQPGDEFRIDLKPALEEAVLDHRLQSDLAKYHGKALSNALRDLLPSKMILPLLHRCGILPDQKAYSLNREERLSIVRMMKSLSLTASEARPVTEAIVTAGGVCVDEVDPRTMASRKVKGLYFAGEILDVDAYTGGFNLQIAFSTGYLAGKALGTDFGKGC